MSYNQRYRDGLLRPRIPFINVKVRAADPGAIHANENVVNSDFRLRYVLQPQTGFRFLFYQSLHDSLLA
jgi:hypothetical protein